MQVINRKAILVMLLIYLALAMHVVIPSMGGSGLRVPGNIVAWIFVALSVLAYWLLNLNQPIITTTTSNLISIGILLLLLPLLYTSEKWLKEAVLQMAGIVAGLVFYFTLLQCRFSARWRVLLLNFLLFATLVQSVVGFIQLTLLPPNSVLMALGDEGVRPTGVFRQVNVMASFMATGLACSLHLLYLPQSLNTRSKTSAVIHHLMHLQQLAALVLLPAMLILLQSRAGYIGAMAVVLINFLLRARSQPRRTAVFICLIIGGILLGYILIAGADLVIPVSHDGSNLERWKILQITLAMMMNHPVVGWGYGSFEYSFAHFALGMTPPITGMGVITHPHNELLFGWVEGGIAALAGYVVLAIAYFRLMVVAWRRTDKSQFTLWLVMLPFAVHTQLEYPFYMSTGHWLIFLLLLSLTDSALSKRLVVTKPKIAKGIQAASIVGACGGLGIMLSTLQAQIWLTKAEQLQLRQVNIDFPQLEQQLWQTWIFQERIDYDRQVNQLLQYNASRDPKILQSYITWSQQYLSHHVDQNVYAYRIAILHFSNKADEAEKQRHEASQIFSHDPRFQGPVAITSREGE
ncbi:Wzy polymerase domain-containing protein [Hafnia alvei]|uniref:PglL family O-oligosaccharyltransferase n=1 Tax=Hafnia alvei TaxID=569 RepID=UPI00345CF1EA